MSRDSRHAHVAQPWEAYEYINASRDIFHGPELILLCFLQLDEAAAKRNQHGSKMDNILREISVDRSMEKY